LIALSPLTSWAFDPLTLVLLAAGAVPYWEGLAAIKRSGHGFPRRSAWCYFAGLMVLALALVSPIQRYSELLLSVHMVQHLLLTLVAPPLILLGAPVTLALQASPTRVRKEILIPLLRSRPVEVLSHPMVGWGLFVAVIWVSHFSPLYERALESTGVHGLEHAAYLVSALLFWRPIVGADPSPRRISHPARLLYLFLAMPQMTFLGLAIYSSDRIMYPHYLAAGGRFAVHALSDQHLAGAIMWTSSMFLIVPALSLVLLDWMNREDREAVRTDQRLARGRADPT
jgi:putative membrane protein